MAIIKCKMCGGDLEILEDSTVCECAYCGTRQTVPSADNEKKLTLFGRAGRLLRSCEFDKAAGVFETIIADFPQESEAYWGLVLCKYGIEYVDDPATGKKIPTCHRSSFESVLDDPNFEQACENTDAIARRVYRDEARAIEALREQILAVSGREEPYDVFISYKETDDNGERTLDSVIAQDIYKALTDEGYRVFFSRISLEDKLGTEYEPYIFAALNSAKVMLAVGTDYENYDSVWVKNEWSRFLKLIAKGEKKTLIPVFKNMDAYDMPKEFAKLAAQDMGKVGAMQDLVRGVEKILPLKKPEPTPTQPVTVFGGPNVVAMLDRGKMALEDSEWDKAKEFFDQALNMDARNSEAYLGLAMAELKMCSENGFAKLRGGMEEAQRNPNYQKFCRFASTERSQQILEKVTEAEREKQNRIAAETLARQSHEAKAKEERERQEKEASVKREAIQKRISPARGLIQLGIAFSMALNKDGTVCAVGNNDDRQCATQSWHDVAVIDAGCTHGVGLRADGTIYDTKFGAQTSQWEHIVSVKAGADFTVGLHEDGTVSAAGDNKEGQCNVGEWKNVSAVYVSKNMFYPYTVGLCSNGTVLFTGASSHGQEAVQMWTDIKEIVVPHNGFHIVGVKRDGSLVAAGRNNSGECDVTTWKDIISVSVGNGHTVGLKSNGTVIAVGDNYSGQCDVSTWSDVVEIYAFSNETFGIRADGTVVTTKRTNLKLGPSFEEAASWRDVVSMCSCNNRMIGLLSDGRALGVGINQFGQCNVSSWKLFDDIETLVQERAAAKEQRIADLKNEQKTLSEELPTIKGLFAASKKAKLEARLAEISAELKILDA